MDGLKILFMGTPEFAAVCLRRLMREKDLEIVCASTPDKPQGRHMILTPSAVKKTATEGGLEVCTPATLKNGAFEEELKRIDPDVIVVVAYGKILPEYMLSYPKYRCINLHGSLLPAFRGAAPMQRAVMAGVGEIGVTTMYMEKGLDTGDMLETWRAPLPEYADFGYVHDLLAKEGAELLLSTLRKAEAGELHPVPQDDARATYAAKIEKADCLLDFTRSAKALHDQTRGLSPSPLAFTFLRGRNLKIVKTRVERRDGACGTPGTVLSADRDGVTVACGEGILRLLIVRPEGKGTMSAFDLFKGRGVAPGDLLGENREGGKNDVLV